MAVIIDKIYYKNDADAPDLGSLVDVAEETSPTKSYRGLESDFEKLPTVSKYPQYKGKLESGSLAIATDTGASRMYDKSIDTWNEW